MVGSPKHAAHANGAEVQPFLARTDFPTERDALSSLVRARGADERVADTIDALPDAAFATPADLLEAIRALDGGPHASVLAEPRADPHASPPPQSRASTGE